MQQSDQRRAILIIGSAIAITSFAEAVYFLLWGIVLFPSGSIANKAIWTTTCGIAMGAVIGAATLWLVEGRLSGVAAIVGTAVIMSVVGSYCAWLCSYIDARFEYFGGSENGPLFILSGVIPAIFGGLLFGWWIYGRPKVLRDDL